MKLCLTNLTIVVKHNLTIVVKHKVSMFVKHLTIIVKHWLTIFRQQGYLIVVYLYKWKWNA